MKTFFWAIPGMAALLVIGFYIEVHLNVFPHRIFLYILVESLVVSTVSTACIYFFVIRKRKNSTTQ